MTITIGLEPDLAVHLHEAASRKGQTTADFLRGLAESAARPAKPRLSRKQWAALPHRLPASAADAPGIPAAAMLGHGSSRVLTINRADFVRCVPSGVLAADPATA